MKEIKLLEDLPDKIVGIKRKKKVKMGLYLCYCGKQFIAYKDNIKPRHTTSCGCRKKEIQDSAGDRTRKHSLTGTKEFNIWVGMKSRCYNPNNNSYKNYGAKGIKVCDRWLDKENGFVNFLEDMGKSPLGYSIDRIDVYGNYSPENCRWSNAKTQQNNRSNNHNIEYLGQIKTLSQWAEEYGFRPDQLICRLQRGWSIGKSLTTPMRLLNKR